MGAYKKIFWDFIKKIKSANKFSQDEGRLVENAAERVRF